MKKYLGVIALALVSVFAVALAESFYTLIVRNSLVVYGTASVTGATTLTGTATINKVVAGDVLARVDSFATTSAVDTAFITGVTAKSVVFVQAINPTWSTGVDSVRYSAQPITGGVVVSRTSYTGPLKSGAHYGVLVLNK